MCTHAGMVATFLIHNIQHGIYHASKSHPLADKCAHVARTGAVWGRGEGLLPHARCFVVGS